jgi:hypothetical protein
MLLAGSRMRMVGSWDSSTPMNSPRRCWIPSVTPDSTKRISPLRVLAASAKALAKALEVSALERKRKMADLR